MFLEVCPATAVPGKGGRPATEMIKRTV